MLQYRWQSNVKRRRQIRHGAFTMDELGQNGAARWIGQRREGRIK